MTPLSASFPGFLLWLERNGKRGIAACIHCFLTIKHRAPCFPLFIDKTQWISGKFSQFFLSFSSQSMNWSRMNLLQYLVSFIASLQSWTPWTYISPFIDLMCRSFTPKCLALHVTGASEIWINQSVFSSRGKWPDMYVNSKGIEVRPLFSLETELTT